MPTGPRSVTGRHFLLELLLSPLQQRCEEGERTSIRKFSSPFQTIRGLRWEDESPRQAKSTFQHSGRRSSCLEGTSSSGCAHVSRAICSAGSRAQKVLAGGPARMEKRSLVSFLTCIQALCAVVQAEPSLGPNTKQATRTAPTPGSVI